MSQLDSVMEKSRRTLRRDGRLQARGRRHPCFGRRARQALLWRLGLAARCRLRRRQRISGPVHASRLPMLDPFRHRAYVGRTGLGTRTVSRRIGYRGSVRRPRRSRRRCQRHLSPSRSGQAARQRSAPGAEQLLHLCDVQRSGRQRVAVAGSHHPVPGPDRLECDELRLPIGSGERVAAGIGRPRRARDAHGWPTR